MIWRIIDTAIDAAIERGIERALENGLKKSIQAAFERVSLPGGELDRAIDQEFLRLAEEDKGYPGVLAERGFLMMMAFAFMRKCNSLRMKAAMTLARITLDDFLRGEGVAYGNPSYDWTQAGAKELAKSEIECWEDAA